MIYYFPISGDILGIVMALVVVALFLLMAYGALIVMAVVAKILFEVLKEPLHEAHYDFIEYKQRRRKNKEAKRKKKWYEDYSRFR